MPEYTNRVINLDLQWNHKNSLCKYDNLQIIWSFKICVHYIENYKLLIGLIKGILLGYNLAVNKLLHMYWQYMYSSLR